MVPTNEHETTSNVVLISIPLRAESQNVISGFRRWAGPESSSRGFIVGVDIAVRAATLEIRVKSDSRGWARRRGTVTARAAICRVLLVTVQVGRAGT